MLDITVIIPTLEESHAFRALKSLKHVPFPFRLHVSGKDCPSWPAAINAGIKHSRGDVLLMDDDIEILPDTFKEFGKYLNHADILGFWLNFPDGRTQHGGGAISPAGAGHLFYSHIVEPRAMVVAHCTASLLFIKRQVIEKIGMMVEDWPGSQFEDVDFSMRALLAGFKIMVTPCVAIHHETATKKNISGFSAKFAANYQKLRDTHLSNPEVVGRLQEYPADAEI